MSILVIKLGIYGCEHDLLSQIAEDQDQVDTFQSR